MITESSKNINGAEPVLWNQNYGIKTTKNLICGKRKSVKEAELQKITISKESKWRICIAETDDYSMIGLLVYHKASNSLISYGNGSSGARTSKRVPD